MPLPTESGRRFEPPGAALFAAGALAAGARCFFLDPESADGPLAAFLAVQAPRRGAVLRACSGASEAGFMALGAAARGARAVVVSAGDGLAGLAPALAEAGRQGLPLLAWASERPHAKLAPAPGSSAQPAPRDAKGLLGCAGRAFGLAEARMAPVVLLSDPALDEGRLCAEGLAFEEPPPRRRPLCVPEPSPAELRGRSAASSFEAPGHLPCGLCGSSPLLEALRRSAAELGLEPRDFFFVCERGCGLAGPACLGSAGLEGPAGSAPALAAGAKLAEPGLVALAVSARPDADALLAAARGDRDLCLLALSEGGGGANWAALALASGAGFVARVHSGAAERAEAVFSAALRHKGFSFVECELGPADEHLALDCRRHPESDLHDALAFAAGPLGRKADGILYWASAKPFQPPTEPLKRPIRLTASEMAEIFDSFL